MNSRCAVRFIIQQNLALTMRGGAFGCDISRCVMFFTPEQAFRKLYRIEPQFSRTRFLASTTNKQ